MRQLLPTQRSFATTLLNTIDSAYDAIDRTHPDRPWVANVMISSLDGSAVLNGHAGGMGNDADRQAFAAMRYLSDAIVVGAETIRAENYGPPQPKPEIVEWRRSKGLTDAPLMTVISATLDIEPNDRLLSKPDQPPLFIGAETASPERLTEMRQKAEVVVADPLTPELILDELWQRGVKTVALEGGPTINKMFIDHGLIDELQLSISPMLVGGEGPRIVRSGEQSTHPFSLAQLWESEDMLIGRYIAAAT